MKILAVLALACAPLFGQVVDRITTEDITDLYTFVQEGTLVIFDVDTTLVDTTHELGSEPWAEAMVHRYEHDHGLSRVQAQGELTPLWNAILLQADVRPIHPQVQAAVRRLQRTGYGVMGITDKDPDVAYVRLEHLRVCDAVLSPTAPHAGMVNIRSEAPAKMVHGLLCAGVYNSAGDVCVRMLDQVGIFPCRVVVVSSRVGLLHDLERAIVGRGIEFVGVRYTRFEERVGAYRPDLAEIQLKLFNRVLSDEAAAALKPGWSFWPFG